MRKRLTILWLLMILSSAWASLLMGAECPSVFYAHEVSSCKVYLTTTGEELNVTLYPHSAKGLFEVAPKATTTADGLLIRVVEINLWAKDAGPDALTVDAVFDESKLGVVAPVRFTNPPLYAVVSRIDAEAGQRKEFGISLVGRGGNVKVWLESPNSSIDVSPPLDLGDVDGEEKAELYVIPSPYFVGSTTLYLHVTFVDENGTHHLKYEVPLSVAPSLYLLAGVVVALAALLLVGLRIFRKKEKPAPNEAQ